MAEEGWLGDLRGIKKVRKDGVELATRAVIDFIGAAFTVDDDPVTGATRISVSPTASAIVEVKAACKCATTANDTLSGLTARDGVALADGDRVAALFQSTASQNGIYRASSTAWTRATDFDASSEVAPMTFITVDQGTLYNDSLWAISANGPIVLGVSALTVKRMDSSIAAQLRNAVISTATPTAGDALLYSSGTACAPGKVADANIATGAAIALSKLAPGTNGQVAKMVGGAWTGANLTVADFGESPIAATPATSQDNWSPAGWSSATIVVTAPSATTTVTGFAAVTSGAVRKTLKNNGTAALVLALGVTASSAANRVESVNGAAFAVVLPGCSLTIYYDVGATVWRIASAESAVARDHVGGLRLCGSTAEPVYYDATGTVVTRRARRIPIPLSDFVPYSGSGWTVVDSGVHILSASSFQTSGCQLRIPSGARLTGFEALVRNNVALSSAPAAYVRVVTHDKVAPYVSNTSATTSVAGVTTAGYNLITVSLSAEIANGTVAWASITAGSNGAQEVHWADMLFEDPGPRNY